MSVSTSLPTMELITKHAARASVKRARKSLEKAATEIVWQVEREVWVVLGYKTWTEMREAEYGGAAFMVPSKNRPELVARLRAKGLTQQEIAATAGVSQRTVSGDLNSNSANQPESITNSRGQQRPATYARTEAEDVVDAEVVEGDDMTEGEFLDRPTAHLPEASSGHITSASRNEEAGPTPVDPAEKPMTTCPTCGGTGKVAQA